MYVLLIWENIYATITSKLMISAKNTKTTQRSGVERLTINMSNFLKIIVKLIQKDKFYN